jgi:hypothetical protein
LLEKGKEKKREAGALYGENHKKEELLLDSNKSVNFFRI